jgi:hypothetical protein
MDCLDAARLRRRSLALHDFDRIWLALVASLAGPGYQQQSSRWAWIFSLGAGINDNRCEQLDVRANAAS